jgi:ubiquitin-like 1-activating enzyme E1 B
MSRATLGDLVEDFLRLQLGYGEEIVVNHGDNLLYDVDETENLEKKLSELGMSLLHRSSDAIMLIFTI